MSELFDTFDESGNSTGTEYRSVVHRQGLWHRAANIFVFFPDRKLLIQQRQLTKDICPGIWDVSTAEHLQPGETYEEGALRGLKEELGITDVSLVPYGEVSRSRLEIPQLDIRDFEFQQSFRTIYSGAVKVDPTEVLDTRCITLEALQQEMKDSPEVFTPWFHQRAADLGLFNGDQFFG